MPSSVTCVQVGRPPLMDVLRPVGERLDAGLGLDQVGDIAVRQRNVEHLPLQDGAGYLRRRRFHQGAAGLDADRFGQRAKLELRRQRVLRPDVDDDIDVGRRS